MGYEVKEIFSKIREIVADLHTNGNGRAKGQIDNTIRRENN